MELLVPALIAIGAFVFGLNVVARLATRFKRTRYWSVPALLFGALSIVTFAEAPAVPEGGGGGPPIIDFGPLPYYLLGLAAAVAAFVAFAAGARARKEYLDQQRIAPPELAVAVVHER
jgi:hypothetical protein